MAPPGAVVAGAVVVTGAAVVAAVEPAPNEGKRLGAALLDAAGAVVVFVLNKLGAAVLEDVAAVVAGVFVNSDVVWVGAVVAAGVVAGAVVVVGNSDEGFEAGVEPAPEVPPPKAAKAPPLDGAVVAAVLLAGAVVAAGLDPNNDGVEAAGVADSAGLEVAAAPPKRVEGVDEAVLLAAGNRLLGF